MPKNPTKGLCSVFIRAKSQGGVVVAAGKRQTVDKIYFDPDLTYDLYEVFTSLMTSDDYKFSWKKCRIRFCMNTISENPIPPMVEIYLLRTQSNATFATQSTTSLLWEDSSKLNSVCSKEYSWKKLGAWTLPLLNWYYATTPTYLFGKYTLTKWIDITDIVQKWYQDYSKLGETDHDQLVLIQSIQGPDDSVVSIVPEMEIVWDQRTNSKSL